MPRLDVLYNWETLLPFLFLGGKTHIFRHCFFPLVKYSNSKQLKWQLWMKVCKRLLFEMNLWRLCCMCSLKCFMSWNLSDIISEMFHKLKKNYLIFLQSFEWREIEKILWIEKSFFGCNVIEHSGVSCLWLSIYNKYLRAIESFTSIYIPSSSDLTYYQEVLYKGLMFY